MRQAQLTAIGCVVLLKFISFAYGVDDSYVDYLMRRVDEGMAAREAPSVTDRLEGANLVALYAYAMKKEGVPADFIQRKSEAIWEWLGKETEPWVRHLLVEGLAEIDPDLNRPRLRELLKDLDPTLRARAAEHLSSPLTGDEELELMEQLSTENLWWVKKEILLALAGGKTDGSLQILHAALRDGSRDVRAAASEALVSRPDPGNVEPLVEALDNAELFGKESPVWALGVTKSPAAADALSRYAGSPYAMVRRGAAAALGEIGDQRYAPILSRLMEDPDRMVRDSAAEALAKVGGKVAALQLLRYLSVDPGEERLSTTLKVDHEELSRACDELPEDTVGILPEPHQFRDACDLVKAHLSDRPVTFWSSGDFHSIFYSPFNAKAREVAPQRGRRAIGWEDFIGEQNQGTKHTLKAGAWVTIWEAAYYQGGTWLEVKEGPYGEHIWVREADLKVISPEKLKNLGLHTNYGADSRVRIQH